jgi:hypothetical protein
LMHQSVAIQALRCPDGLHHRSCRSRRCGRKSFGAFATWSVCWRRSSQVIFCCFLTRTMCPSFPPQAASANVVDLGVAAVAGLVPPHWLGDRLPGPWRPAQLNAPPRQ